MVVFRKMFDQMGDEKIKSSALALIETEDDEKYRNKFLEMWKDVLEQTKKPTQLFTKCTFLKHSN